MAQQQDFSAVKIETQQLAPGLYMLMGSGGNMALSTGPDGAVLVDTEYAPLNAKFIAAVNNKIPPSPAAALPTVTFPARATFHWNGNTVNVIHVNPAHTDGDS